MTTLKIYGDVWNIYRNQKVKIYLKKHNLHNKQRLYIYIYDC
jgi:hypothetical protein